MARVRIVESLKREVFKKFKAESVKIFKFMQTLGDNPNKGKIVGRVGGLLIKELKYQLFRFYFIVDGNKLKIFSKEELIDLLIKFVRMSDKKSQQKVINEIKIVLTTLGTENF